MNILLKFCENMKEWLGDRKWKMEDGRWKMMLREPLRQAQCDTQCSFSNRWEMRDLSGK